MNKSLIAASLLVLLAACASEPGKEPGKEQPGAAVEERTPGAATGRPSATTQAV